MLLLQEMHWCVYLSSRACRQCALLGVRPAGAQGNVGIQWLRPDSVVTLSRLGSLRGMTLLASLGRDSRGSQEPLESKPLPSSCVLIVSACLIFLHVDVLLCVWFGQFGSFLDSNLP